MLKVTDCKTSKQIQNEFDHVIGMLDPCERSWQTFPQHPSRFMVWFTDTVHSSPSCPSIHHIRHIIELFKIHNMHKGNVLIHCHAGISRSTAVAIGLLVMQGIAPEMAFKLIHDQRPRMWPNELILKHFDEALHLGNALVDADKKWKSEQPPLIWD